MINTVADLLHFVADHAGFHAESDLIAAHEIIDSTFPSTGTSAKPATPASTGVVTYASGVRYVDGVPYTNAVADSAGFTYASGVIELDGVAYTNDVADANGFTYSAGLRYSNGVVYTTTTAHTFPTA